MGRSQEIIKHTDMKILKLSLLTCLLLGFLAVIAIGCNEEEEPKTEICDNGQDDDNDGFADCEDNDCIEIRECDCSDGQDNDMDGFTDCEDSDCQGDSAC